MTAKIREGNKTLNVSISQAAKELLKSKSKNKRDLSRLVEEAIFKVYGKTTSEKQLEEMFLAT